MNGVALVSENLLLTTAALLMRENDFVGSHFASVAAPNRLRALRNRRRPPRFKPGNE
jgi:hypothetical protein